MPFDQTAITEVFPPAWNAGQIHVRWASTAPDGSWHQVYLNRKLAWWGRTTRTTLPAEGPARIDVGVVDSSERSVDFSASLPAPPGDRVTLRWDGGTFQAADIVGFRIYGSSAPDQPIDYTRSLAEVLAYTPGVYTDGFGLGGFGEGGFGAAASSYSWTSGPLKGGGWLFAVAPFDAVGNEGTPAVSTTTIYAAPAPPARNARGDRLTYAYSSTTRQATLSWLASPG